MDAERFLADLEAKPEALGRLADLLDAADPFSGLPDGFDRIVFLGMGSSRYAAGVAAQRLRAAGVDAVAEYASASAGALPGPRTVAVVISASGGSRETLDALSRHAGRSFVVAMTNRPGSPVTEGADLVVHMAAGDEAGGVACRTFQHTVALLLAMTGRAGVPALVRRAAEATADLLDRRGDWLDEAARLLDGPHGVYTVAPAERLSSAEQSALMFREGPRRQADACETGDWAHVDVYLTKTYDYRAIVFPGSRYDEQAMEWVRERGSAVLTVGGDLAGQAGSVRYLHDDDRDVALLTEPLVAELVAASYWRAAQA
ncbi:SIS domain-containing protein [Planotetraspora kaengkrachanensis]|uniref:Glutamine--fructose-6-phosphate aminotransferase [isomerizing] n=1 Tax=Planotetraspora kaengkrachanensis TaxID=575193 RepID=A0A8J3PR12_9ACTN|nr:SIS domain-containing protein [Planotetraspora kaengkrachanensis]GIG79336.1 sigma factor regulator FecR [Planotetraspora kaengkrachanensis]